jgi:hypothetical protein
MGEGRVEAAVEGGTACHEIDGTDLRAGQRILGTPVPYPYSGAPSPNLSLEGERSAAQ